MRDRAISRMRRHRRIRKRVVGYPDRLRLAIFRSHKHLVVQLINDLEQKTVLGYSTKRLQQDGQAKRGGNVAAAEELGRVVASEAKKLGIQQVVFDRGGYRYHGRIKALADAARQGGLQF
ncbi:MAG: 50S ribosomal protein L18 [Candidatus Omnitrophica bacterium]|nr:50S ribosomal protein L18 [Candidatus Omnitrophota bacterium]